MNPSLYVHQDRAESLRAEAQRHREARAARADRKPRFQLPTLRRLFRPVLA